jgi:hypothetical protein
MANAAELTRQGIAAAQAGDNESAADLLRQATEADPKSEMAWLWRSSVARSDDAKRYALQQALAANPQSQPAMKGLALLGPAIEAPPELAGPIATPVAARRLQDGAAWKCSACGGVISADSPHCRHCKAIFDNLYAPGAALAHVSVQTPSAADDRAMLQWIIATRTAEGWQIVSQSDSGVQFKKPKQWSVVGLLLFVATPAFAGCLWYPAFGIALIGLILVLADYLMRKEELAFISPAQAREEARQVRQKDNPVLRSPR